MKRFARMLVVGVLAASPVLAVSVPALACGNSYRYEIDPKTNMVVRAEEALHEGDYRQAWKLATGATGNVKKAVEDAPNPLRARSLRVAAIAVIRTKGSIAAASNKDPQGAASYTAWAVDQLRVLAKRESGNPYLRARLAEGLSINAEGRVEALKILSELADADMMPDAQGWLLYAELSSDPAHKERGIAQCKLRATDAKNCTPRGPGEI